MNAALTSCERCGYTRASYSHRLGQMACGRCYFGSIPEAERRASDDGWARRDLAGQVRAVASRLRPRDARKQRLLDLAFDLEIADRDSTTVQIIRELRREGVGLEEF